MADPLSMAASVAAFVQLADRLITGSKKVISGYKDAPHDFNTIIAETSALKDMAQSLDPSTVASLHVPAGTVDQMKECLEGLIGLLPLPMQPQMQAAGSTPASLTSQPIKRFDRLGWVRKKSQAFVLLAKISQHKQTILLGLSAVAIRELVDLKTAGNFLQTSVGDIKTSLDCVQAMVADVQTKAVETQHKMAEYQMTVMNVQATTADIRTNLIHFQDDVAMEVKQLRDSLSESRRREILGWLITTDPYPRHNESLKLHQQDTSDWAFRHPSWTSWLEKKSPERLLWVHGIPGAGKTVLCSCLVTAIENISSNTPKTGWAFYYCLFDRNQNEADHFLCWVLSQLSQQVGAIPGDIITRHLQRRRPKTSDLLDALAVVSGAFESAFIVLDAVDESMPRDDLLRILEALASQERFSRIRILATSREYLDIEEILEPISIDLPMDNEEVGNDIRLFLRGELPANRRLRRWSPLFKELEDALVTGAKGMFRWVVCQLHILGRLPCTSEQDMRAVLSSLPKDLDATYIRIFELVPDEQRQFLLHTLLWICGHEAIFNDEEDFNSSVLLSGITRSLTKTSGAVMGTFDLEYLREVCGCLVRVSTSHNTYASNTRVLLAHYTVREFLAAPRIAETPVADFHITCQRAVEHWLDASLDCILDLGMQHIKPDEIEPYMALRCIPFWGCTPSIKKVWHMMSKNLVKNPPRWQKLLQIADPRSPHYIIWSEMKGVGDSLDRILHHTMIHWLHPPSCPSISLLVFLMAQRNPDLIGKFISSTDLASFVRSKEVLFLKVARARDAYGILENTNLHGTPVDVLSDLFIRSFHRACGNSFLMQILDCCLNWERIFQQMVIQAYRLPMRLLCYTIWRMHPTGQDPPQACITPLQSAAWIGAGVPSSSDLENPVTFHNASLHDIVERFLNLGADPNALGKCACDRSPCQWVARRVALKSPLRILQKRNRWDRANRRFAEIEETVALLVDRGARDFEAENPSKLAEDSYSSGTDNNPRPDTTVCSS